MALFPNKNEILAVFVRFDISMLVIGRGLWIPPPGHVIKLTEALRLGCMLSWDPQIIKMFEDDSDSDSLRLSDSSDDYKSYISEDNEEQEEEAMSWMVSENCFCYNFSSDSVEIMNTDTDTDEEDEFHDVMMQQWHEYKDEEMRWKDYEDAYIDKKWKEIASISDVTEVIKDIKEHKAAIIYAIMQNKQNLLQILLELSGTEYIDCCGWTLLHYVVKTKPDGYCVLEDLLNLQGFDIDARNDTKTTALVSSIKKYKEMFALQLIEKGADVNLGDMVNMTPLHYAVLNNLVQIGKLLIERGANVDACDRYGATPLFKACEIGATEMVCLLLCHGANPNIPTVSGYLPFHVANSNIQEILYDYIFDGEKIPFPMITLAKAMASDSSLLPKLFPNISKVTYNKVSGNYFCHQIPRMNPYYLKLCIEKFNDDVKNMLKCPDTYSIFQFVFTSRSIENYWSLLESNLAEDFVEAVNRCYSDTGLRIFMEKLHLKAKNDDATMESKMKLIEKMIDSGITFDSDSVEMIYIKYGFCPLFKKMISSGPIKKARFRQCKGHIMPRLIYDLTWNIDKFLIKRNEFSSKTWHLLLEHFAHNKVKAIFANYENIYVEFKVRKLPQIPSLVELARNTAREYIIEVFNVQNYSEFCNVLRKIPINEFYIKILTFERKLYKF